VVPDPMASSDLVPHQAPVSPVSRADLLTAPLHRTRLSRVATDTPGTMFQFLRRGAAPPPPGRAARRPPPADAPQGASAAAPARTRRHEAGILSPAPGAECRGAVVRESGEFPLSESSTHSLMKTMTSWIDTDSWAMCTTKQICAESASFLIPITTPSLHDPISPPPLPP
jgi:hypothetical protein